MADIDEIVKRLREAANSPEMISKRASNIPEFSWIDFGNPYTLSGYIKPVSTYIALAANHMPAILDALAERDQEIERLRGAIQGCLYQSDMRRGWLMLAEALNPSKDYTDIAANAQPHPDPLVAEVERRGKA